MSPWGRRSALIVVFLIPGACELLLLTARPLLFTSLSMPLCSSQRTQKKTVWKRRGWLIARGKSSSTSVWRTLSGHYKNVWDGLKKIMSTVTTTKLQKRRTDLTTHLLSPNPIQKCSVSSKANALRLDFTCTPKIGLQFCVCNPKKRGRAFQYLGFLLIRATKNNTWNAKIHDKLKCTTWDDWILISHKMFGILFKYEFFFFQCYICFLLMRLPSNTLTR